MNRFNGPLQSHFGLTPAEARLALHLVVGDTLQSAAIKLDISYETARCHLRNMFNKTGVHRQAELVAQIVTAFPACLEVSRTQAASRGATGSS